VAGLVPSGPNLWWQGDAEQIKGDPTRALSKRRTGKTGIYKKAMTERILTFDQMMEGKNPCWPGYKQLGTKTKKGKTVPYREIQ